MLVEPCLRAHLGGRRSRRQLRLVRRDQDLLDSRSGTCQSRLPAVAACTNAFGACVDGADCDLTSFVCKVLDGAGAACSAATSPSNCLAGYCGRNGTCPDPLAAICS